MNARVALRRRRLAIRLAAGAIAWSVGLLLTALLAPLYNGQASSDGSGITLTRVTYVQSNGAWALIPLAVPLLAGVAVAFRIARTTQPAAHWARLAVAVTAGLGLVLIVNVGGLLLPVAGALALALRLTAAPRRLQSREHPLQQAPAGNDLIVPDPLPPQ